MPPKIASLTYQDISCMFPIFISTSSLPAFFRSARAFLDCPSRGLVYLLLLRDLIVGGRCRLCRRLCRRVRRWRLRRRSGWSVVAFDCKFRALLFDALQIQARNAVNARLDFTKHSARTLL